MKINRVLIILLVISMSFAVAGCERMNADLFGEYEFESIAVVGGISSLTADAINENNSGNKYIIEKDKFAILEEGDETSYSDIRYESEKLTEKFITQEYGEKDSNLNDFFEQYSNRYRYTVYNENDEKLNYCIYALDDEVFVSQFAKQEDLFHSINRLEKLG